MPPVNPNWLTLSAPPQSTAVQMAFQDVVPVVPKRECRPVSADSSSSVQQNVTFDSSGKLHPLLGLDKRLPIENLHGPQPVYEPMGHYQHVGGLPLRLHVISE